MAITYHSARRIQGLSTETIETATLDHDFTESGSTSHTGNGTSNSVEGWTTNDYTYSKIDGGNDRLDFRSKGDGTNDSITYDLGSALSDSAWLIRFELTFSTLSSTGLAPSVDRNESVFGVFSSDYSSGFTTAQDSLGFQLHIDRDGTDRFYVHNTDGSSLTGYTSGQRNDDFTTTTYYVQMKRTSSTDFEVKFYDSTYTTEISGDFSSSVTVPSTVTGLRYFGFKNSDNYNYTGDGAGYINNVKIYDGVTSISSKPTNIQRGSRFEETDTRKMYYYGGGGGSITKDAQATIQHGTAGYGAPTTFSSFVVGNNSNRALIVATGSYNADPSIISVKFNGTESFTKIQNHEYQVMRVELWILYNPTVTTADVVIEWGTQSGFGGAGAGQMGAICYSFYNVKQSDAFGTPVTKDGSASATPFIAITPTTAGSMIIDSYFCGNDTLPNNDLTDGMNIICGGVDRSMASQYDLSPTIGSANNMSRTAGNSSFVQTAVEIKVAVDEWKELGT